MKYLSPLFILSLILAFITGQLITQFDPDRIPETSEIKEINQVLDEVVQTIPPLMRLDLNTIYSDNNIWELFVNNPTLKSNKRNSFFSDCDSNNFRSQYLNQKEQIWLDFVCLRINRLPPNFFKSKPLVAPDGESYIYKAYQSARYPFSQYNWLIRNLNFFKPAELKELDINFRADFQLISLLNSNQSQLILKNAKMIQVDELIFLKTGYFQYYVMPIEKLNKILSASLFEVSLTKNNCSFVIGNVCWRFKEVSLLKQFTNKTYLSFITTIILLLTLSGFVYKTINGQKQEQERKKHAFRVLTHELRTPISSLILQLDRLTQKGSKLDRDLQTNILEIESEVYRLKQLANKSESILNSDDIEKYKFKEEIIYDLKDFIEENIRQEELINEVESGLCIKTDTYWFLLCLQNIINNAFKHGIKPVKIYSEQHGETIEIIIQDQGNLPTNKLKILAQDFSHEKGGLGLGLNIVNKTLKELNAGFKIRNTSPSEFSIIMKKEKNG